MLRTIRPTPRAGTAAAIAALLVATACGAASDRTRAASDAGPGSAPGTSSPEDTWLAAIGTGAAQKARVCERKARDGVSAALCGPDSGNVRGLEDLYRALGFGDPDKRYVAATTHSLALSAHLVSAANPRAFVFAPEKAPLAPQRLVVTAFARGEQLVELAALDAATLDYNFYLLRFEQDCNRTRCTPEELLTEKVERDWTSYTLYTDRDLEDTPLDCLSCHLPFGAGTHKQLLMRQTAHPWFQWGDYKGVNETRICYDHAVPPPGQWLPGEGLTLLAALEGQDGRYAGLPIRELVDSPSGERFSLFLTEAENTIRESAYPAGYPYAQLDFDAATTLCERLATGTSPTWDQARAGALAKGLLIPFYGPDVLDPAPRAQLAADRTGFLEAHENEAAADVAAAWFSAEASEAIGFVPRRDATAPEILRSMCIRCHSAKVPPAFARAGFNAEDIGTLDPVTARAVRERVMLPRSSAKLMPPLRSGELPPWAVARIDDYLRHHCTKPGACDK